MKKEDVRKVFSEGYAQVAKDGSSCCAPQNPCCGTTKVAIDISKRIGYTDEDYEEKGYWRNMFACAYDNDESPASLR